MNILWLELESLLPATTGGRIGSLKRLEQIAKTENVYLFYPYDDERELDYVQELKLLCREVHPYSRRDNRLNALIYLYKYPYTVGSRYLSSMRMDISDCLQKNAIDIINVDFPHMCVNLFDLDIKIPVVLNQFNVEWMIYRGVAKSSSNLLKKTVYWIDSFRLNHYEKKIPHKLLLSRVTYVSDKDMIYLTGHGFYDRSISRWVPVGADVLNMKAAVSGEEHDTTAVRLDGAKEKIIIFTGKMSYGPNVQAAQWFVREIFPLIQERVKPVKFYIVGKDPTEEVKRLASDQVIVTGFVESPDKYFEMADLVVLPLRNGGGVKVKLLQAVSHKKPIVSTSKGVEGIQYADGKTIPIADEPVKFAKLCIDILCDPESANEKQQKAYEIFLNNYTWDIIGKKYLKILKEAAGLRELE